MPDIKKKVTLKDIAEKTGLSVNTVSRVLNKKTVLHERGGRKGHRGMQRARLHR